MTIKDRFRTYLFGDIRQEQFSNTPLIDYIDAEQRGTLELPIVTRDEALSVPGVMRARNTIASIATLPLLTYSADWKQVDNPLFRQIDPTRANVVVLADTLEDLLLNKFSYWRVLDRDESGFPASAEYVSFDRVDEQQLKNGRVTIRIDGKLVSWADVIKFESPNPAFLRHGGRVVKRALDLDLTAAKYARNPRPLDYFTADSDVDPVDDAGIRAFLQKWKNWLLRQTTGYVPAGMKYVSVEQPTPAELQLIEAQKQVGLSIANMTGLDPEDLGISTTSRTYTNIQDKRRDQINQVFAAYMRAITDRLSMGDVTKNGDTVSFDLSDYMKANDLERAQVEQIRLGNSSLTMDEVRVIERMPKLATAPAQPVEVT